MCRENQSEDRPYGKCRKRQGNCLRFAGWDVRGKEPEGHGREKGPVCVHAPGDLHRERRAEEVQQYLFRPYQFRQAGAAGIGFAGLPAADGS